MKLKSKLLVSASTLALAGTGIGIAAPAAHAAITPMGSCSGSILFAKISTPVKGQGLGDQTRNGVKVAGNLAKDQTTKAIVDGGTCSGTVTRPGDPHVPGGANPSLTGISQATSLLGNGSCANGANDKANDATAANAYPISGKITWKFSQTYTDLLTALVKNYQMQADVVILGFSTNPLTPDVVDLGGIVLTGASAGGNVSGSIWEDPVAKTGGASGYNTGYELDLGNAAGCADDDGSPPSDPAMINNANITQVLSGSGAHPSLLGSTAPGLTITGGE